MSHKIVIYSSDFCPFCHKAKHLLHSKGVKFDEKVVDGKPAVREESLQLSGRTSVPQIWIGERHVGGCDDLYALESAGKLDPLLATLK